MFSNLNKPAFGASTANSSFGFPSSTPSNPFGGQNQLFGKPSGSTAPAFGQTAGTSLFPGSRQESAGVFQSSTPWFGAPAAGQIKFGAATTSQFMFNGNVFGGTTQQDAGGSFFGGQQNKVTDIGFGAPSPSQSSFFGQSQPTAQQTNSPFQASTSGNLSNVFGSTQQQGTVIKFQPLTSTDTMLARGVTTTFKTKHICITCMKEYEGKSFEELRWEDYQANRKGPQQQNFGVAPSTMAMFGQPQNNKPVFKQSTSGFGSSFGTTPQASTSQNIFEKPAAFGTTATTASAFGFGTSTLSSSSPFAKPSVAPTTKTPFGPGIQQTSTFAGGIFSQQQSPNLFGKPQTTAAFGTGTPSFIFSAQPASQTIKLFSTSESSKTFPAFVQTTTAAPVYSQQQHQQPAFIQPTFSASTFGKPATSGFRPPAQPAVSTGLATRTGGFFTTNTVQPLANMMASQLQANIMVPQLQANMMTLQPQANMMPPQPQANMMAPQRHANMMAPQPQANIMASRPQPNIMAPRPQANIMAPRPHANMMAPQTQANMTAPQPQANIMAPRPQANIMAPRPQANVIAPQLRPQSLPLPNYSQHEDYKMALHISDQFGQLTQLTSLNGDYTFKKCEAPIAIKQEEIQQLLVRPIGPPQAKVVKKRMVIAT